MRTIETALIAQETEKLIASACLGIEPGALAALRSAAASESSAAARFALDTLCQNAEIADERGIAVCQDTGMAVVFLEIGQEVRLAGAPLYDEINAAVGRAYKQNYFRMSVCDPITRINTGDNSPAVIHTDIVAGDKVTVSFLPKGFGSENMSRLFMLSPSEGMEGVKAAAVTAVREAGANPCPPVIVGLGLGGTSDLVMLNAKKALLRSVGTLNPDARLRELEAELLGEINALGIGAQGFGGSTTALAVHIIAAPTHIASLPVGINIQCNSARFARTEI